MEKMFKKAGIIAIICAVMLICSSGMVFAAGAESVDYITIKGVQYSTSLTELDLCDKNLQNADIVALQYMTNLTNLDLSYNQISDLRPLSGLTNLSCLYLYRNQIRDLTPLSGLTKLTDLLLPGNQISDLKPLTGLTKLTTLFLGNNQISDLTPLSRLTNLTTLTLDSNQISDLTPLSGLTKLTELDLSNNQISDLTPLPGLTKLTRLYLNSNQISNLRPLSGLTNLNTLWLENNQISDWSPVAHVPNVEGRPAQVTALPIPEPPFMPTAFSDLPASHWAYDSIMLLVNKGVVSGYPGGTFRPNGLVTRSEFAKMMTLTLEIPLVTNAAPSFIDVNRGNWDFVYVETTKKYLTGFEAADGLLYFKGSESAVREDMAVALVKALGLENQQVDVNELKNLFKDYSTISPNLQRYVLIAYKNGLISGYPDGTFGAQKSITRAETAALLVKVLNSKITFDGLTTPVIPPAENITSTTIPPSSYLARENLDFAVLVLYKDHSDIVGILHADGGLGMGYYDCNFAVLSAYSTNSKWVVKIYRGDTFIAEQQFQMTNNLLVVGDILAFSDANFTFSMDDFTLTDQQKSLIKHVEYVSPGKILPLSFTIYPAGKSSQEKRVYLESIAI